MNLLPKSFFSIGASALICATAFVQSAHGVAITTEAGVGADSFIEFGADSGENLGSETILRVRLHPDNATFNNQRFTRRTILRFDTTGVTETPTFGVAGDVSIQFTFSNGFDPEGNPSYPLATLPVTLDLYGLIDGVALDASPATTGWVESTVSADTAPGGNNYASLNGDATGKLASVTITSAAVLDDIITFSSSALTNFLLTDTNNLVTFILYTDDPTIGGSLAAADFYSKEGAGTAPTMTIIPEPSTYAVIISTMVGMLIALRRRRC